MQWKSSFRRLPPELYTGAWKRVAGKPDAASRRLLIERIVKFGIPGTDMPGHEYFSDADVVAIGEWLERERTAADPR